VLFRRNLTKYPRHLACDALEEREAKQKQDEEEAARVYESFVASFQKDERSGKTFVDKDGKAIQLAGSGKVRENVGFLSRIDIVPYLYVCGCPNDYRSTSS
jgi:hypothetical protein